MYLTQCPRSLLGFFFFLFGSFCVGRGCCFLSLSPFLSLITSLILPDSHHIPLQLPSWTLMTKNKMNKYRLVRPHDRFIRHRHLAYFLIFKSPIFCTRRAHPTTSEVVTDWEYIYSFPSVHFARTVAPLHWVLRQQFHWSERWRFASNIDVHKGSNIF